MGKLNRRDFAMFGAAALTGASSLALGSRRPHAAETITFGGSVPLSGRAAETGLNVYNGYRTAVKYFNEELGGVEIGGTKYTLGLDMVDDASDPQRATSLLQRQLDQGINFFLGSFSSTIVLPTAAIAERARKPMVQTGGGSDQIFTQGYRYIFGMYPRASKQFISSVKFFDTLEPRPQSAVIINTNDAFSKTQAEGAVNDLEAAGYEVLDTFELPAVVADVSSVLNAIRSSEPDMVICTTHDENSLLITRQMAASGTNTKLLYQTLGPQLASYRETLGKFAEAVIVPQYWDEHVKYGDEYFGGAQQFAEYYRTNFDRPIAYHVAGGAACIVCYVKAMQTAGTTDTEAVREALAALDFDTFYTHIKFTPDGDGDPILMGPAVGQVQNGEVVVVHPEDAAYAEVVHPMPKWEERA
jgi:branched-chain amino acid transport system substrate-binding protein